MKEYVKPIVLANEELAEGVYAASGADCYTVNARIVQKPETGRGTHYIQVDAKHDAADGHHGGEQVLTISFNEPVVYQHSNGTLVGGDGTTTLEIRYSYHSNAKDNIGLGSVEVVADVGLAVTGTVLSCNYDCGDPGHKH